MSNAGKTADIFLPFLQQESDQPRYRSLFHAFRQAILQGQLQPGTKLPASRPLSKALGISRNTVKTVYEMLLAEGYLETRQGAGSFVSSQIPEQPIQRPSNKDERTKARQQHISTLGRRLNNYHQPDGKGLTAVGQKLLLPAQPCLESFPWSAWQKQVAAAARSMKHNPSAPVVGSMHLREQIADYLGVVRGVNCTAEQVMICSGSQHALSLALRLLADPGDPILVENPAFTGLDGAIATVGATKIPVPVDRNGFVLSEGLRQAPAAKVAITTPSRNYPLGHTLSLERRLELLGWAKDQGAWLIEDDYDSEFRFDGPPLSAMQGMGGQHSVIYTGTFSRVLHPAIRLGYLVLPPALIESFSAARHYLDGGLSLLPQLALATFMASGQFNSHVRRMRKLYAQRRQSLDQKMAERFKGQFQQIKSDGGMHSVYLLPATLCKTNKGFVDQHICRRGWQQGLGIRALSSFFHPNLKSTESIPQGLVIGFAGYNSERMDRGLELLESVIVW